MENKYLILYHNEDNDGLFSAAIMYNYLINELHILEENITLEGVTYNILKTKYPSEESIEELHNIYTHIIMTDISFSYNIKIMKALKNIFGGSFIWIDHHKPIIDASYKYKFDDILGIRETTRSAILNMYKYLYDQFDIKYNDKNLPELLRILSAWDSFSYEREKIKFDKCYNVNKAVTFTFNLDITKIIPFVNKLLYNDESNEIIVNNTKYILNNTKFIRQMNKLGKQLNDYDLSLANAQITTYGDFEWKVNGEKSVMIMFQGPTNSQMFKSLQNTDVKHAIILKYTPSGNWTLSLYNINIKDDKNFHCGNYLKEHYKGGGHAGAGGATFTQKTIVKLLKTKEL